ncbi:MAG: hypothetical protein AB1938_07270 [Myxococcota bacterium]
MGTMALVLTLLAADGGTDVELDQAMKANLAQVASVLPFLANPDAFRDPKNAKAISATIDVLGQVKHITRAQPNVAVGAMATLFEQEVARTREDFDHQNKDSARQRMVGLTRMCIGCHSRAAAKVDWKGMDGLVDSLKLTPLQRANFYVGTHQFGRAKEVWAKALAVTPTNDAETFEQAQALRLAVATLTRAEHDADGVLALVKPQLKRRDFPGFVQRAIKRWNADAAAWRAEGYEPSKQSAAQLLTKAEALLTKTGATTRMLSDDEGLVPNMRAAAYAQRALDGDVGPAQEARALYFLALAHASASDPALWQLEALLLERCVHLQPHTPQAQTCAERLADRVGFAYHGSLGGPVPANLVQRIGELRVLAAP